MMIEIVPSYPTEWFGDIIHFIKVFNKYIIINEIPVAK